MVRTHSQVISRNDDVTLNGNSNITYSIKRTGSLVQNISLISSKNSSCSVIFVLDERRGTGKRIQLRLLKLDLHENGL